MNIKLLDRVLARAGRPLAQVAGRLPQPAATCWAAGALALAVPGIAAAQSVSTELPPIVVTTPSPIVRRAPARPEPGPQVQTRAPVSRAPASRAPAPASTQAPAVAATLAAGPGTAATVTFVPVTVVTANQITASPGATLGDVLSNQPGITSSTFAPGSGRPIIRGLDNFRVRVQENGVNAMDVSPIGEDHGVPIDPLTSERIEVIRGPGTLRYGSQAIGGVVSAENNRIPLPDTEAGVHTTVKSAVSSVDRGVEGGVLLDGRGQNFAVHGDFFGRTASDYRISGGIQANTALNASGESVGGSYFLPDGGFIGASVTHFASLYHIPGTEAAATNNRIDLDQVKLNAKGEFRLGGSLVDTVRFWLGASDYKHNELGAEGGGPDGIQATFKNREQEGRVELQLTPATTSIGVLNTALGIQVGHQNLGTAGAAGGLLAPSETTRVAGYIFNELQLTPTTRLQAAGRVGRNTISGSGTLFPAGLLPDGTDPVMFSRTREFTPLSASFGLLQDVSWGVVAGLNASYVERAPEALELFAQGAHDAPGTFEIGNADLKKESATSIEASLRRVSGDFRFDATAYHTYYQGFIFKRLTGVLCGEDFSSCGTETDFKQVFYGQQDATFTGAEISAQYDFAKFAGGTLGIDGRYDIVRARFTDGTNVPRIPPQRIGGGLYWRDANWFARVGILHAFDQTQIAPEETTTPGYNLLRAELSYTRKLRLADLGPREVTLGVVGTNLLDEDVRNAVSFKKDEVLQPGRGVRVFSTVRW